MWAVNPLDFLRDPDRVALAAPVICVWAVVSYASLGSKKSSRLFSALALFAFHWALLIPYYVPKTPHNAWLPAFSGFVSVYAGLVLNWEAWAIRGHYTITIGKAHSWPVLLLIPLVIKPTMQVFQPGVISLENQGVYPSLLATAITVCGYISIWNGFFRLYEGEKRLCAAACSAVGVLLLLYIVCEVSFYCRYWASYHEWSQLPPSSQARRKDLLVMGPFFKYLFAGLKVAYTGLFLLLIAKRPTGEPKTPRASFRELVVRFWKWLTGEVDLSSTQHKMNGS